MAATNNTTNTPQKDVEPGFISRFIGFFMNPLMVLLGSLLLSIAVEIIGMIWIWPEQGVEHSINMLRQEVSYVNDGIQQSLFSRNPGQFTLYWANTLYEWSFIKTGIVPFFQSLNILPEQAHSLDVFLFNLYQQLQDFITAALVIAQVFFLRVVILVLSSPIFIMFGIAGLVDGLVQRDLRKFGAGKESGFIYHHAKRVAIPCIFLAWVVYLSLPFSLHPGFVLIPFAILFALGINVSTASFKKYL